MLSPFLFAMFVNELIERLAEAGCRGVQIGGEICEIIALF